VEIICGSTRWNKLTCAVLDLNWAIDFDAMTFRFEK